MTAATFDESVRVVDGFLREIDNPTADDGGDSARELLDAIGYRQMQERIESLDREVVDHRRGEQKAFRERDAARALADRLADAELTHWAYEEGPATLSWEDVVEKHQAARTAYEARGWK